MAQAETSSQSSDICQLCLLSVASTTKNDCELIAQIIENVFKISLCLENKELLRTCLTCRNELNHIYAFYETIKEGLSQLDLYGKIEECVIKEEAKSPIPFQLEVKFEENNEVEPVKESIDDSEKTESHREESGIVSEEIGTRRSLRSYRTRANQNSNRMKQVSSQGAQNQDNIVSDENNKLAKSDHEFDTSTESDSEEEESKIKKVYIKKSDLKLLNPNPPLDLDARIARLRTNYTITAYERRRIFFDFACCKCFIKFDEEWDLAIHFKEVHNMDKIIYFCCGKKISKTTVDQHIRYHADPNAYKCVGCDVQFPNKARYRVHALTCKNRIKCPMCTEQIKPYYYRQHIASHSQKKEKKKKIKVRDLPAILLCDLCGLAFKTREQIQKHIRNRHMESSNIKIKPLMCEHCAFTTKSKTSLASHIKFSHTGIEKEQCPVCNRFVKRLRSHFLLHHDKTEPSPCQDCGETFENHRKLEYHRRRKHMKLPNSCICRQCGRGFKAKWQLSEHEHTHLGVYKYSCKYCSYQVNYIGNLKTHMRTKHTEHYIDQCAERLKKQYGPTMVPKTLEGNRVNLTSLKLVGAITEPAENS